MSYLEPLLQSCNRCTVSNTGRKNIQFFKIKAKHKKTDLFCFGNIFWKCLWRPNKDIESLTTTQNPYWRNPIILDRENKSIVTSLITSSFINLMKLKQLKITSDLISNFRCDATSHKTKAACELSLVTISLMSQFTDKKVHREIRA